VAQYQYSPRDFTTTPSRFGRKDVTWKRKPRSVSKRAQYAASVMQHNAARIVIDDGDEDETGSPDLEATARRLGVTVATLRRKLYGESPIRLDELIAWTLEYGVQAFPEVNSLEDLFPPRSQPKGSRTTR